MTLNFKQWRNDLTKLLSAALCEFRCGADDEMEIFAVDCHPWNGVIALAFLTKSELKDDPLLSEATEMAAWKYYDFSSNLTCWQSAPEIALRMGTAYQEGGDNRSNVAKQFFREIASAVASKPVQDVLSTYRLAKGFKIKIPHPDSGEDYYPPK